MDQGELLSIFLAKANQDPRLNERERLNDASFPLRWSNFVDILHGLATINPPLDMDEWELEYETAFSQIFFDPDLQKLRYRFWDPNFVNRYTDFTESRDRINPNVYINSIRRKYRNLRNQQRWYDRNYSHDLSNAEAEYIGDMAFRQYNPDIPREVVFNRRDLPPPPRGFYWQQYATDGTGRQFYVLIPRPINEYAPAA